MQQYSSLIHKILSKTRPKKLCHDYHKERKKERKEEKSI